MRTHLSCVHMTQLSKVKSIQARASVVHSVTCYNTELCARSAVIFTGMSRHVDLECKVYVGNLPRDATEKDLERAFEYYGPIKKVWVARNPPGFAFVEYEDARDAEDAIRELDDTTVCGARVRVERSSGKVRPKPWNRNDRGPPRPRFPVGANERCFECGERGHYAYDCSKYGRGRTSGGSRRRSRSRSRSRSVERRRTSRSRTRSRSRSRSRD